MVTINLMIGEEIISPGAKQGLIPLVIPLSRRSSGMVGIGDQASLS